MRESDPKNCKRRQPNGCLLFFASKKRSVRTASAGVAALITFFLTEGDGFAGNDGVVITPTASRTLVGATPNTFDWTFSAGTKADNYKVETAYGLLSILNREAQYDIRMKANSDTVEYDGEEHSVSGFEKNEFEVEGSKYTVEDVEAEAKGIEAGVYTTDINGTAKVSDAGGNDVTGQFAVSYESGSFGILGYPEPDHDDRDSVLHN